MGGLAARLQKNKRRQDLELKLRSQRIQIKEEIRQAQRTGDTMKAFLLSQKLDQLPRDSSKTRTRNRCRLTGRPKSSTCANGTIPLSRITTREYSSFGLLPGVRKV